MSGAASRRTRVPISQRSVAAYNRLAAQMADLYESTTFEAVHAAVLDLLPPTGASVLDVGAGSGRDAAALIARGYAVTAVEPSVGLRQEALHRHGASRTLWLDDTLPHLIKVGKQRFALILVSAVWMHIAPRDRSPAMRRLAELLSSGGRLIVSLRFGPDDPERSMTRVDASSVEADARDAGLMLVRRVDTEDALGRNSVSWATLVFDKA